MATKKYQVFVSSTFKDLVDERQDTIRNILDLNHIPAGMELFPAADVEQLDYIKKVIDECDYYLLIVGGRYGSLDADGVSFTEREYDYAVSTGKFVIAFVHGDPGRISVANSDIKPELVEALNSFRQKVMTGRLVRSWKDRQDLQLVVLKSLAHVFSTYPQVGWIRGDTAANDQLLAQSNQLLQENAKLASEIAKLNQTRPPEFADLAGLNDATEVRYRVSYWTGRDTKYLPRTVKITWAQLFLPLAAELATAKTDKVIIQGFRESLREAGLSDIVHDMNDIDKARIKVQFAALGLITLHVSKTTQGVSAEFLSLTPKGKTTFMETIVARKPPAE